MKKILLSILFCLFFNPSFAFSKDDINSPADLKKYTNTPLTKVLNLGTAHLRQLPEGFKPEYLEPVLTRLKTYNPDIITIESISGQTCSLIVKYKEIMDEGIDYCKQYQIIVPLGFAATGLDTAAAEVELYKALDKLPKDPSPIERRKLVLLFLASGDQNSALVQWLSLKPNERIVANGISQKIIDYFTIYQSKNNENINIAVKLAVDLRLNRVYPIDDHTADFIQYRTKDGFAEAIQNIWAMPSNLSEEYKNLMGKTNSSSGMLENYRYYNAKTTSQKVLTGEWKLSLENNDANNFGRQYIAWYETRNLRMVSNIRSAIGNNPGAKVLNIVGFSHKPFYDEYMSMMMDIEIIDAQKILE